MIHPPSFLARPLGHCLCDVREDVVPERRGGGPGIYATQTVDDQSGEIVSDLVSVGNQLTRGEAKGRGQPAASNPSQPPVLD